MKLKTTIAKLLLLPLIATAAPEPASLAERNETLAERDARMEWFRDAHFGMFVHWGLYAVPAGIWKGKPTKTNNCAEWLMRAGKVPIAEYSELAKEFNPQKYDADQWVVAAKNAGMKYITITAKHHEGFAMFKSKASAYNIVDATPYQHDPLKDLAKACKKHGIKLGLYYSQNLDWYHPGGHGNNWDPASKGDPEAYVDHIVIPQLKEILSNYGEISILWFDIPNGVINKARADRIMKVVYQCNPDIIVNNRLGGGYKGDIQTPEQHIPPMGFPGKDWEVCMTMNKSWGFAKDDSRWKPSRDMIRKLCDIASKGGNYLLNVGPTDLGEIPDPSLERLAEIGEWMKINSKAIHGTRASVFPLLPKWGRLTTRLLPNGNSILYAMVFNPPKDGTILLPGLMNTPVKAVLLGSKTGVRTTSEDQAVRIEIPKSYRNKSDFVIALLLKGTPHVDASSHADQSGSFTLLPRQAQLTKPLRLDGASGSSGLRGGIEEHLSHWTKPSGTASWNVTSKTAAKLDLYIRIAAPEASDGSVIEFSIGNQMVELTIQSTGSWKKFTEVKVGTLRLPKGKSVLTVKAKTIHGEAPCNLGTLRLSPSRN